MTDRIHRALDGELPTDGLTPKERAELQRCRAIIGTALEPIRRFPAIDVSADVMRRVKPNPAPARGGLAGLVRWLWSPRAVTLRPAWALAGGFVLAVALGTSLMQHATPAMGHGSAAVTSVSVPAKVMVQFRLGDAEAREVALVGDFNDWKPEHRLHQVTPGVWVVDVELAPGVYHYVFVVDGRETRLDPLAARVTDGFGGASSRVAVLTRGARS